jgi:hypothetical protein
MIDIFTFLSGCVTGFIIGFIFGIDVLALWLKKKYGVYIFRDDKGKADVIQVKK